MKTLLLLFVATASVATFVIAAPMLPVAQTTACPRIWNTAPSGIGRPTKIEQTRTPTFPGMDPSIRNGK